MSEYLLHGYGESVASNVVRLALSEKNISYDYNLLYLESKGDHLKDDNKKLNPKTLIPTLVVNKKPIPESIDIMKFIDNEYPYQGVSLFPANKDEEFSSCGPVAASDAFFPFADSIIELAKAGIKAVIQPGGSIKDAEVIDAVNKYSMAMVFTHTRHFKH